MTAMQWADAEGEVLTVFRALANAERLAVLDVLRACGSRGMNISQVGEAAELNRFTASRHLKALCSAGLVTSVRHNQSVVHRLDPAGFERVEDWLYETAPSAEAQRFG
ncbi:helix-turn-helix transcriptional regulator [Microbacterium sp. RU33B]|uniref:ArsR/SmtB family transcription factor n=1 Tax=Microbacterium sp. RU33B TaxID=1907390 RepID=UPI0009643F31|nr:helix-turn-helix domain-containing protein [Microbacterium sp. RU33B]SIT86711.1 DNA-binding transcriptional regulator, ArsR family [Microbacterium sp. RU33B]